MARSVLLLLTGAVAGGAGVLLLADREPDIAEPPAAVPAAPVAPVATSGHLGARVAAYERAAGAADALDIASMLDFAAARPPSRSRDLEISALITRLAEIDPMGAVEIALSGFLETRFLIQAFEFLAVADADASIARLAGITPRARQRQIALAVLGVIGNDERGIARVAEALPDEDRVSFALDALIARAEIDPPGALEDLLALDSSALQSLAMSRLAEAAARQDPVSAMALAVSIADPSRRRSYQYAVLRAWAEQDADAVFRFFETAPRDDVISLATAALATLARSDPDRLRAMAESWPPSLRANVERAVGQRLAERDPVAALAMLQTMPPGQDRDMMLQTIAQAYGRQSPDLALAWAKSLTPPSDVALRAVLQGIAATDVDRAIDLLFAEIEAQGSGPLASPASVVSSLSLSSMLSIVTTSGADVGRVAEKLLGLNDPQARSMLMMTLTRWASRDGDAAVNWFLANADRVDASTLRNVASQVAGQDLNLAMRTLDQLLPEQRAGWIQGLASQIAQTDVDRALGLVERYRGQPGYDEAYGVVVTATARTDPARAASMLTGLETSTQFRSAASTIAREWAGRDPAAAAQWALNLGDAQVQTRAMNVIASTWATRDSAAAERWLFTLSRGPNRDSAADGYLSTAAQVGQFEPRLLEAYSSDDARQRGAGRAIAQIARNDPDRAKELLNTYVTDPAIRSQTEQQIANATSVGSGVFISNGGVIYLQ